MIKLKSVATARPARSANRTRLGRHPHGDGPCRGPVAASAAARRQQPRAQRPRLQRSPGLGVATEPHILEIAPLEPTNRSSCDAVLAGAPSTFACLASDLVPPVPRVGRLGRHYERWTPP